MVASPWSPAAHSGIGQGIVRGFVAEGAAVAIADTNRAAADALVDRARRRPVAG